MQIFFGDEYNFFRSHPQELREHLDELGSLRSTLAEDTSTYRDHAR